MKRLIILLFLMLTLLFIADIKNKNTFSPDEPMINIDTLKDNLNEIFFLDTADKSLPDVTIEMEETPSGLT